jgi:DNA-binding transcriptional LysR family regulator
MLDFELLRAFVAVADCGGFHRAAERLNLTQPTLVDDPIGAAAVYR